MNQYKILIPQLISPTGASFFWRKNAENIFNNLTFKNKHRAVSDSYIEGDEHKYAKYIKLRNKIIEDNLTDEYTHVFWMDVDIVEYPYDIIEKLLSISSTEVVAPYIYIEDNDWWPWKRFYDISCFIDSKGIEFDYKSPYNTSDGDVRAEVNSVGTCFIIPAHLHKNISYDINDKRIDHVPFFEKVRRLGHRIIVEPKIEIKHAFLPKYGERFH
jgi:hypothetical protein